MDVETTAADIYMENHALLERLRVERAIDPVTALRQFLSPLAELRAVASCVAVRRWWLYFTGRHLSADSAKIILHRLVATSQPSAGSHTLPILARSSPFLFPHPHPRASYYSKEKYRRL